MAHHTTPREAGMVFAQTRPKLAAYTHLVFLASEKISSPTIDDLVADVQTDDGPLQVGLQFEIGEDVTVRQYDAAVRGNTAVPKSPQ